MGIKLLMLTDFIASNQSNKAITSPIDLKKTKSLKKTRGRRSKRNRHSSKLRSPSVAKSTEDDAPKETNDIDLSTVQLKVGYSNHFSQ